MTNLSNGACSVHDAGGTVFIVVAPEPDDVQNKERIFEEVQSAFNTLCRGQPPKRIRVSLIAPPGHVDIWGTYNFIAPKVKALQLDFKEHNIQVSVQKIGDPLTVLERMVCQTLCLAAGVTWGGCLPTKRTDKN